ncbi:hypothetical protein [Flavobacterium sp.]|uniref:hypothetical protein n=1 Tax=Flavobacterium sp. TaxID=239 RepID=UPI002617CF91|nr:hypothetical protein [Flavobacterium sp.]
MSKQISNTELAQIVSNLLTSPEKVGELCTQMAFSQFMTDIAEVVTQHCGGQVSTPADTFTGSWLIAIRADESLPENGGIWQAYDEHGSLTE